MISDYWIDFWQTYAKKNKNKDLHTQVLRTYNKEPIDPEVWDLTLDKIMESLDLAINDTVLDLCCGNGLLAKPFSKRCSSVTAVDISKDFIEKINKKEYPNIKPIVKDIRKIKFSESSFTKVIIYAGLQYLNYEESLKLLVSIYKWLKSEGVLYIGDIPDRNKLWNFYNNEERVAVYFNNLKKQSCIVGTWFEQDWLTRLAEYCGFSMVEIVPQDSRLIYSHFRFDMIMKK